MSIRATILRRETFEPYGSIISPAEEIATYNSSNGVAENNANQGTAIKLLSISQVQNSSCAVIPHLNLFRCKSRGLIYPDREFAIAVSLLEKHPQSSQTFIPMGTSRDEIAYIVVVALAASNDMSKPDLSTIKAFACKGNQAVTYGAGVWHAPMIAVSERSEYSYVDFAVLIYENDDIHHPELDCVEYSLETPVDIIVDVRSRADFLSAR